jgi:hypothetical protein
VPKLGLNSSSGKESKLDMKAASQREEEHNTLGMILDESETDEDKANEVDDGDDDKEDEGVDGEDDDGDDDDENIVEQDDAKAKGGSVAAYCPNRCSEEGKNERNSFPLVMWNLSFRKGCKRVTIRAL